MTNILYAARQSDGAFRNMFGVKQLRQSQTFQGERERKKEREKESEREREKEVSMYVYYIFDNSYIVVTWVLYLFSCVQLWGLALPTTGMAFLLIGIVLCLF